MCSNHIYEYFLCFCCIFLVSNYRMVVQLFIFVIIYSTHNKISLFLVTIIIFQLHFIILL